jgi:hypothetical protein
MKVKYTEPHLKRTQIPLCYGEHQLLRSVPLYINNIKPVFLTASFHPV